MVTFYFDENVERAITLGLRSRGVDVITVDEDGMKSARDSLVLDRATILGRVAFSRDQDFLIEGTKRQAEHIPFAGIVYAHKSLASVGECVSSLELLAKACQPSEFVNRVWFIPL